MRPLFSPTEAVRMQCNIQFHVTQGTSDLNPPLRDLGIKCFHQLSWPCCSLLPTSLQVMQKSVYHFTFACYSFHFSLLPCTLTRILSTRMCLHNFAKIVTMPNSIVAPTFNVKLSALAAPSTVSKWSQQFIKELLSRLSTPPPPTWGRISSAFWCRIFVNSDLRNFNVGLWLHFCDQTKIFYSYVRGRLGLNKELTLIFPGLKCEE